MGKDTSIAWTDHTFNPWWGCTEVSPGCDLCYAREWDKRMGGDHWGTGHARREFQPEHWRHPLSWNRAAKEAGTIANVFCMSMGDVMDPEAPEGARERLWPLINSTGHLRWLLLTKRPQLYLRYLPETGFVHDNVRLGTTTENQQQWDVRMPALLIAAAALTSRRALALNQPVPHVQTFASYEPSLGPIEMHHHRHLPDQVIFGGETGPDDKRRPCDVEWARQMREQCENRGVAFFMKQLGGRKPKDAAAIIPAGLLIRQAPEAR